MGHFAGSLAATHIALLRSIVDHAAEPAPEAGEHASRVVDLAVALIALTVLAPLMAVIFLAIKWRNPGPALFAQHRIGRDNKTFRCFKFRTMVVDAEARLAHILDTDGAARAEWQRDRKLRNDPRITGLGRFLRRSSLDELPQLFNVIRGDMSVVGPRPIVAAEIPLYGRAFHDYCSVRPGITGLWQTSGRNDLAYRRRVAMDVVYTRKKSLAFDLWIIVLTVPAVLLERGSY